jgi:ABC-2 type transport system permease protein
MNNRNDKNIRLVYEVAKWEFRRWFKLKEQIITLLIGAIISVLIFGGKYLIDKFSDKEIEIVIINSAVLPINLSEKSNIILLHKEINEIKTQLELLNEKKIDGIFLIKDIDNIELTVKKEPAWLGYMQEAFNSARQQIKLEQSNISPEQLKNIFEQPAIKLIYTEGTKEKSSLGEKITAGVFIGLMLVGIFLGLAYQFVAITGEKQLRITEVIVSAISPQTWIDGKIVGISLLSLALLVTYSLGSTVFVLISSLFGSGWSLPIVLTNPVLIIGLFLFSICGFFFWNTFFAAIAATINDPNASARGALIMVPSITVAIAFFALGNPDSLAMKILSFFPLTSAPVISVRLVLTEVSLIEIAFSLLLLVLSTWYLRKAAGKIFSLSILMYGKEPSWNEISKWFKESRE